MASTDNIEPKAPTYTDATADLKKQKSSSTEDGFPDDKERSGAVAQYGVDPEKQSSHVGSLREEESETRGPVMEFVHRHWKIPAQIAVFILFTVLVT